MLTKLAIGMVGGLSVILIAAFAAPLLIPTDFVKAEITMLVKDRTGRDLHIAGPVSFTLLPRVVLRANGLTLSNPPGDFQSDILKVTSIEVRLKPLPLLRGTIKIDHVNAVRPKLSLEVDREGRRNWIVHRGAASAPTAAAGGGTRSSLAPGVVGIVDGETSYLDQRRGQKRAATAINIELSLPSFSAPAHADGSATVSGVLVRLALNVAAPGMLRDGAVSPVMLRLISSRANLTFEGEIGDKPRREASGTIEFQAPSLRDFAAWLGRPLPARESGFGRLSVSGRIDIVGERIALTEATIGLDAIMATGMLSFDRGGVRPSIAARLDVDQLDFNPYLGRESRASPGAAPGPPASSPPAVSPFGPTPTLAAASPGWSAVPFDLLPLNEADAELTLRANSLRFHELSLGKTALGLHLKDARLQVDLPETALYRGTGIGTIVADGNGAIPAIAAKFDLHGVDVGPLLSAVGIGQVTGHGDLTIDVAGHGRNQREVVASLSGQGSINFADGRLICANLAALLTSATGRAVGDKTTGVGGIDYTSLTGTGTIANGILHNGVLKLVSPKMTATGAGTIDLPQRRLDYLWQPNFPGLGSARIAVTGSWDDPRYRAQSVTITRSNILRHPNPPGAQQRQR